MSDPSVESTLESLLGTGPVPFPARSARNFEAWHRPRKQYVRERQWNHEIRLLMRDIRLTGELHYLTLPGVDLLDIRHIAISLCEPSSISLKYLGFNTAAQPRHKDQVDLNSTSFSLNRMPSIDHENSEVFPGDFRHVGVPRSVADRRMRRSGPYHAVNLDLCGGFAGRHPVSLEANYFSALDAVIRFQGSMSQEFVLFVTTRVDEGCIDQEFRERLASAVETAFHGDAPYAEALIQEWKEDDDAPRPLREFVSASELFMLGFAQWIVTQSVLAGFRPIFRSLMSYRTGTGAGDDDLASFAFRMRPVGITPSDEFGLINNATAADEISTRTRDAIVTVPPRVSSRVMVDHLLIQDQVIADQCIEDSVALLTAAGYDVSGYRAWADMSQ